MISRIILFLAFLILLSFPLKSYAQEEPIVIERPLLTISFVPPGPLGDLEVTSFLNDTTVTFFGEDYEIRLVETGTVFFKRANINYQSRAMAAGCGKPRSYRQSDFTKWFTGVSGGTSSTPLKVNGYNACLQLSEGLYGAKDEEPTFSFTLSVPFYTFSCTGPVTRKEDFLETLRSFSFYDIDPKLQVPSDKKVPEGIVELTDRMIFEPFEQIVDTDVVMSRDDDINVDDIMNPMCNPNLLPSSTPLMRLGLTNKLKTIIRRDGFVSLSARAEDLDLVHLYCRTLPKCGDEGGTWLEYFYSPTEISWKILNPIDEVSFVEVGYLPEKKLTTKGESIIIRPPNILKPGEVKTVKIQLKAEDIGVKEFLDQDVVKNIEVVFVGEKNQTGEVDIKAEVKGDVLNPYSITQPKNTEGDCQLVTNFGERNRLEKPQIKLPAISDASSLVLGEKLMLTVPNQKDEDIIKYSCNSDCGESEVKELNFPDEIIYTWAIESGNGHFNLGGRKVKIATGKSVVYQAAEKNSEVGNVRISVYASNRNQALKDVNSPKAYINLNVLEPAILLSGMDKNWLPEYEKLTELDLSLATVKNRSTGELGPAVSHMSAFVNLGLDEISQHEGICTNYDDPDKMEFTKYDVFFDVVANLKDFTGLKSDPMDVSRASFLRGKTLIKGKQPLTTKLKTMDFGASGKLKLENYPSNYTIFPNLEIAFPFDENNNGIPDAAKKHDNAVSADYDSDDEGLDVWTWGDGLTNWEEYRGFRVCVDASCKAFIYKRTDPEKRDFFLYSEFDLTYTEFEEASDLNVEFVNQELINEGRVINYLSNFHKGGDQYAVHVKSGEPVSNWSITSMLAKAPLHLAGIDVETAAYYVDIFLSGELEEMPWWFGFYWSFIREGEGVLGKAQHADGFTDKGYFTPNQVKYVVINPYKVARLKYDLGEVVYHELGHTCNLPHHGGDGVKKICLLHKNKSKKYDYITGDTKYSGEMSCMMRYEYPGAIGVIPGNGYSRTECVDCDVNNQVQRANHIQLRDEVKGWRKPDGTLVKRDKFCTSRGETHPYGGSANNTGECYKRIRVKCWGE